MIGARVLQGLQSAPIKMGLFETSSTLPDGGVLGQSKICMGNKVYYLALAGTSILAVGKMCQGPAPISDHRDIDLAATPSVGDYKVSVTLAGSTAVTANQYAGGTLHVNSGTGAGYSYKISSHLAITGAGTGWFNLYDPIVVAPVLGTSSDVTLTLCPFNGTIVTPSATLTQIAVGVPVVAVTGGYYYWSQTWGECAVLTTGTVVIGNAAGPASDAGACGPVGAYTTCRYGDVQSVNATTEYSLINLKLFP